MKTETNEFYKLARKQQPEREKVNKGQAWFNKAYSGKCLKSKTKQRDESKLF